MLGMILCWSLEKANQFETQISIFEVECRGCVCTFFSLTSPTHRNCKQTAYGIVSLISIPRDSFSVLEIQVVCWFGVVNMLPAWPLRGALLRQGEWAKGSFVRPPLRSQSACPILNSVLTICLKCKTTLGCCVRKLEREKKRSDDKIESKSWLPAFGIFRKLHFSNSFVKLKCRSLVAGNFRKSRAKHVGQHWRGKSFAFYLCDLRSMICVLHLVIYKTTCVRKSTCASHRGILAFSACSGHCACITFLKYELGLLTYRSSIRIARSLNGNCFLGDTYFIN